MGHDFTIDIQPESSAPVVRITGEVDVHSCPKLNDTLTELINNGNQDIILNLDNVHYIDSTGLGSIAHAARQVENDQGKILIVCTKPQVKKIFEISGLEKKNISLHDTEEIAIEATK